MGTHVRILVWWQAFAPVVVAAAAIYASGTDRPMVATVCLISLIGLAR